MLPLRRILLALTLLAVSAPQQVQARPRGPGGGMRRPGPPPGGRGGPGGRRPCPIWASEAGLCGDLRSITETETQVEPVTGEPEEGGSDGGTTTEESATEQPATEETPDKSTETEQPSTGSAQNVPYFYQYANKLNPEASCQNSSLAMLLNHYGVDVTPDQITSRFGKDKAQSPEGLAQVFNQYASEAGISERLVAHRDGSMSDVNAQLQSGTPTIVHGYFTAGHVVLATGFDGKSYTVNDPAGRWSGVFKGGYGGAQSATSGQGVQYGYSAFRGAIATWDGYTSAPIWWHEVVRQ